MPEAGGRRNWGLLIIGYKISVMPDELILEICRTTLCLQITILYCALKKSDKGVGLKCSYQEKHFKTLKRAHEANMSCKQEGKETHIVSGHQ